jgi:hypothetical protein
MRSACATRRALPRNSETMLTEQDAREVEDHSVKGEREQTLGLYP